MSNIFTLLCRATLPLLDGTRNKSQLLGDLRSHLGNSVDHEINAEELDTSLRTLANCGLLVG